jgi:hypothetical protein
VRRLVLGSVTRAALPSSWYGDCYVHPRNQRERRSRWPANARERHRKEGPAMSEERTIYLAEKFLRDYRNIPVEKRLAFDAWADRYRFDSEVKRRLWREVKYISRRQAA